VCYFFKKKIKFNKDNNKFIKSENYKISYLFNNNKSYNNINKNFYIINKNKEKEI
jgi:hypothetical protein